MSLEVERPKVPLKALVIRPVCVAFLKVRVKPLWLPGRTTKRYFPASKRPWSVTSSLPSVGIEAGASPAGEISARPERAVPAVLFRVTATRSRAVSALMEKRTRAPTFRNIMGSPTLPAAATERAAAGSKPPATARWTVGRTAVITP